MEDELRLSLLFAGTCFIIAVLAHGIWKIRKNSKPSDKPRVEPRQWDGAQEGPNIGGDNPEGDEALENEGFDELGIGQVRVVKRHHSGPQSNDSANGHVSTRDENSDSQITSEAKTQGTYQPENVDVENQGQEAAQHGSGMSDAQESVDENAKEAVPSSDSTVKKEVPPKLYGSVVSNPKPHLQGQVNPTSDMPSAFPEPPGFLLKEQDDSAEQTVNIPASEDVAPQPHLQARDNETAPTSTIKSSEQPLYRADNSEADTNAFRLGSVNDHETPAEPSVADKSDINEVSSQQANDRKKGLGKRTKPISRKRQEPRFGDDQMRIDFDENDNLSGESTNVDQGANASGNDEASSGAEQEVLVLNVRAPSDEPISGAALLPMLLTLGFKFGDQNIFHRHVNSNGKGPVLFSLANMFKPGVFDIDNLETFTTQGVSLFMILPIEGDPHQVFNMMHNAARKLADEFGAQVLDGRRSVLTKQGLQQYMEKIREFERKRMISR